MISPASRRYPRRVARSKYRGAPKPGHRCSRERSRSLQADHRRAPRGNRRRPRGTRPPATEWRLPTRTSTTRRDAVVAHGAAGWNVGRIPANLPGRDTPHKSRLHDTRSRGSCTSASGTASGTGRGAIRTRGTSRPRARPRRSGHQAGGDRGPPTLSSADSARGGGEVEGRGNGFRGDWWLRSPGRSGCERGSTREERARHTTQPSPPTAFPTSATLRASPRP